MQFHEKERFTRIEYKKGERKPFKPKPWSHQSDLSALKGKLVHCDLTNCENITGALIEADNFTLKIRDEIDSEKIYVIFKSSIIMFSERKVSDA